MRIVRQRSPDRFTVLDNALIESRAISYRELGVITYLLSRPNGWETDSDDLAHTIGDPADKREGRDAVRTALRHLKAAGYLQREKIRDPASGRFATVTTVTDRPHQGLEIRPGPGPRKPAPGNPAVGKLGAKNPSTDPNHGSKALGVPVGEEPPPGLTSRAARPGEEDLIDITSLPELGDVLELCAEVRVIRRDEGLSLTRWTDSKIRRAIGRALLAGYPAAAIPDALRELARDPSTQTPGRLPHDGPWWTAAEADELRRRRLDQAARARTAAAAAAERRIRDCPRCDEHGRRRTLRGEIRCDHIPEETETA